MNQVVFSFAGIEIHAFTLWIMAGVLVGALIVFGFAYRAGLRLTPVLDVTLACVVGGVIGARAGHVWLNWAYFTAHTDQITDLRNGGLDWHGAVVVGLIAAVLMALIRRVPLQTLFNALALAFPIGAIAGWSACGVAEC